MRRLVALALALALVAPGRAEATACQGPPAMSSCIDSDNLWPHAGGGPFLVIGAPESTPAGAVSIGLVTSFFTEPLGVRIASASPTGSTAFLVDNALDATLLLAWGIADRLDLTVALPWTLVQTGAGLAAVAPDAKPLATSALRDIRFGFTLALLQRAAPERGPALALRFEASAPTGNPDAFATSGSVVFAPSLSFAYRVGRVDLAAEADLRVRRPVELSNAVVGTEIGGAIGASVDVIRDRWLELGAEAFVLAATSRQGSDPTSTTPAGTPLVPAEWIAHASTSHFLDRELTLGFGGGTTLPFTPNGAFSSPRYRLDLAVRYTPTVKGAKNPR